MGSRLVRPGTELIRRPGYLDLIRRGYGINAVPQEISLEPARVVVPALTPVVGDIEYSSILDSTTSSAGKYGSVSLGLDDSQFAPVAIDVTYSNVVAGSFFRILARFPYRGGIRILKLGKAKGVTGTGEFTLEEWPFLYYVLLPPGARVVLEWRIVSDGTVTASVSGGVAVIPVYQ